LNATQARQLVLKQLIFAMVLVIAGAFFSLQAALSILLGGMASALPNAFFSKQFFSSYRADKSQRLLMNIYAAELSKLLFTASIFLGVMLLYKQVQPLLLFAAYLLVHMFPAVYAVKAQKQ